MVKINIGPVVLPRPELLLHGVLPSEAVGNAPRVKNGQEWWDKVRRETYAKAQGNCMACGNTSDGPLQAHETYKDGEWGEVVALCPDCHAFIHIGFTERTKTAKELARVYRRGVKILMKAGPVVPTPYNYLLGRSILWTELTKAFLARLFKHNMKVREHETNKPA